MRSQECEQCGMSYGTLHRAGECHLYECKECGCTSCERCVVLEPLDLWSHMRLYSCPGCLSSSLEVRNLTDHFSIYSSVAELASRPHVIALLFVPRSCYPRRSESLINEILGRLADFDPAFCLLNEEDSLTRKVVSEWFPSICNPNTATGDGSVIWLCNGQPVQSLRGGPYMATLDLIRCSRTAWS